MDLFASSHLRGKSDHALGQNLIGGTPKLFPASTFINISHLLQCFTCVFTDLRWENWQTCADTGVTPSEVSSIRSQIKLKMLMFIVIQNFQQLIYKTRGNISAEYQVWEQSAYSTHPSSGLHHINRITHFAENTTMATHYALHMIPTTTKIPLPTMP